MRISAEVGDERFAIDSGELRSQLAWEISEHGQPFGENSSGAFMSLMDWVNDNFEQVGGVEGWGIEVDAIANIENFDGIIVSLVGNSAGTPNIRLSARIVNAAEVMPIENLAWDGGETDDALNRVVDCWVAMTVRVIEEANLILDRLSETHSTN